MSVEDKLVEKLRRHPDLTWIPKDARVIRQRVSKADLDAGAFRWILLIDGEYRLRVVGGFSKISETVRRDIEVDQDSHGDFSVDTVPKKRRKG